MSAGRNGFASQASKTKRPDKACYRQAGPDHRKRTSFPMANLFLTTPAKPVNAAVALAALKAADTAVTSSQDVTAKLIALRKELEALRAERDQARFRVE